MANTYKWEDNPTVDAYLEHHGFDDCVYTVHWMLTGTSSETNPEGDKYTASVYGTVSLDLSDLSPASYVSKDDLTTTIVNDWVKAVIGDKEIALMKAQLKNTIDKEITPTTETFKV